MITGAERGFQRWITSSHKSNLGGATHRVRRGRGTRGHTLIEMRLAFLDHFLNALESPIDFLALDDERRRDTYHAVMDLLAEDSLALQGLTIRTSWTVEFNADPETRATDFFQVRTAQ